MKISELIVILENIKSQEGDLNVCRRESHNYWGSIDNILEPAEVCVVYNAQPKGPKSGETERAVVIGRD